jgi:carotenoid cleavage dioxygenase
VDHRPGRRESRPAAAGRPSPGIPPHRRTGDLTAGTVQAHEFGQHATAGEAVFAPAAPGAAEDDGYVMAFIHNPDRGAADLVLLAAQDFTAEPIARVHLPTPIPLGFHGSWIPDP